MIIKDLGSKDLNREKVYLICQTIRIGSMEWRDPDPRMARKSSHPSGKKTSEGLRRPFGVAGTIIAVFVFVNAMK